MESKIIVKELDQDFCDEVASLPGGENIKKCFACGTCAAGCPVTGVYEEYNCRTIIRQILLGMRDEVLKSPIIWYCLLCYRCHARCPQKVNFTDIMRALRYLAVKYNYVSQDILEESVNIDNIYLSVRRDIMTETIEGKKQLMEAIQSKITTA